jgi:hypothetical protein
MVIWTMVKDQEKALLDNGPLDHFQANFIEKFKNGFETDFKRLETFKIWNYRNHLIKLTPLVSCKYPFNTQNYAIFDV